MIMLTQHTWGHFVKSCSSSIWHWHILQIQRSYELSLQMELMSRILNARDYGTSQCEQAVKFFCLTLREREKKKEWVGPDLIYLKIYHTVIAENGVWWYKLIWFLFVFLYFFAVVAQWTTWLSIQPKFGS